MAKLEKAWTIKVFIEKYIGTKKEDRKIVKKIISVVQSGTQLLVTNIDFLTRNIVALN
ncbi:recombinase family protein [Enterococcus alishanensis]